MDVAGAAQGHGSSVITLQTSMEVMEAEHEEDVPDGSPTLTAPLTLQMLIHQTHPEEPFRSFIPSQISELKSCMERFEGDRLASYVSMRVVVSGACGFSFFLPFPSQVFFLILSGLFAESYKSWYVNGGGLALWSRIAEEFPDHMHVEPSRLENPASLRRPPLKKRARKSTTPVQRDISAKKRRTNRRHAQAALAKEARDSGMGLVRLAV